MIVAVYVGFVYLIITVVTFFLTRYTLLSEKDLDKLYSDEIERAYILSKSPSEEDVPDLSESVVDELPSDLLALYDQSRTYQDDIIPSDVSKAMKRDPERVLNVGEIRQYLSMRRLSSITPNDLYRYYSLRMRDGSEVFNGSIDMQLEVDDDGERVFLKNNENQYMFKNIFGLIEWRKTKPDSGFYFFLDGYEEGGVRISTSKYLRLSTPFLTKKIYDVSGKQELIFEPSGSMDLEDVNNSVFILKIKPERKELGNLFKFENVFRDDVRFVVQTTNGTNVMTDVYIENNIQNGSLLLRNINGMYLTVNTDINDVINFGEITFTTQGTPLFLRVDINDNTVYRLETREDTYGLFLTHYGKFSMYDNFNGFATLNNTKLMFRTVVNNYTQPSYYPTCDDTNREIFGEKCHTKCDLENDWFRDGEECKIYGACPRNYKHDGGLVCLEECSKRPPAEDGSRWFNGSSFECARCKPGWSSDGALLCKKNGAKWYNVFTGGYQAWHHRNRRGWETWTGAKSYTSDQYNTTTGFDPDGNVRVPAAEDTYCEPGSTKYYMDSNGNYKLPSELNDTEKETGEYILMCLPGCYNNLYTQDDSTDEKTCTRTNYDTSLDSNF